MLPIDPRLKVYIEAGFVLVLLLYLVWSWLFHETHLTAYCCVILGVPLVIDIVIFHAVRPTYVWLMLNIPFLALVVDFIYVKIIRKAWRVLRRKLALLATLLFGG